MFINIPCVEIGEYKCQIGKYFLEILMIETICVMMIRSKKMIVGELNIESDPELSKSLISKIHAGWWKDKTSIRNKLVDNWTKEDIMLFYDISAYEYHEIITLLQNSDFRNLLLGSIKATEQLHLNSSQM